MDGAECLGTVGHGRYGYGNDVNDAVTLVVGEPAGNAVRHGRVRGRDFRVRLRAAGDLWRVEAPDARAERPAAVADCPHGEGGRGLLLAAAEKWGAETRPGAAHKVVRAQPRLTAPISCVN